MDSAHLNLLEIEMSVSEPERTELPLRVPVFANLHGRSRVLPALWDSATIAASLLVSMYLQGLLSRVLAAQTGETWRDQASIGTPVIQMFLLSLSVLLFAHLRGASWHSVDSPEEWREQLATLWSGVISVFLLSGAFYLVVGEAPSRQVILFTAGVPTAMLALRRFLWSRTRRRKNADEATRRNVLIVGLGHRAKILRDQMDARPDLGYRFCGFIDPGGGSEVCEVDACEVLGCPDLLVEEVRRLFIDEVFLTGSCDTATLRALKRLVSTMGVTVRQALDPIGGVTSDHRLEYVGHCPTVTLYASEISAAGAMLKRTLDLLLSTVIVVVLIPFAILIAIAIKMDSPGPVLYASRRVGLRGRSFLCLKFRTMVADAELRRHEIQHLNQRREILFKVSNDPRITRVGAFLRKYSLDELPQFINVLRGEMSIVGPRPPLRDEVEKYRNGCLRRLSVLPGITGLWQVGAREDPSFESYISLDIAYIENWSLGLDLSVIARTVGVVLSGTGS